MTTTVRLPLRLEQTLGRYCVEHRRSKSEVIIELLEQRFSAQSGSRAKDAIARKHGRAADE